MGRPFHHGSIWHDLAGPFTTEGAIACIADRCGLLDKNGSFITPIWNRQSGPFSENYSEGLAPANKDGQWGTSTAQEASSSRFNSNTWGSSIKGWQI
jgi:hypothetical protein